MNINIGRACITLAFEWMASTAPPAPKLELETVRACRAAVALHWMPLMEAFDLAPEAFDSPNQHLGPLLRAVLEGCACAVLSGAPNPMSQLAFVAPGFSAAPWNALSRAIASARALRKESPYYVARSLLQGPYALGVFNGLINFDGSWTLCSSLILQRVDPCLMIRAVADVARAAEGTLLLNASRFEQVAATQSPRRI